MNRLTRLLRLGLVWCVVLGVVGLWWAYPRATHTSYVEVPGQKGSGGAQSLVYTYPNPVTAGNFLVCAGAVYRAAGAPTSITASDTRGTTWTVALGDVLSGSRRTFVAYTNMLVGTTGANTVTVVTSPTSDRRTMGCDEFSGAAAPPVLDVVGPTHIETNAAPHAHILPGVVHPLLIGIMLHESATTAITPLAPGNVQIAERETNDATNQAFSMIYNTSQLNDPPTNTLVEWTLGASKTWAAQTVSFKPAPDAPPPPPGNDFGGYRPHYQGYGVNTPGGRGGTVCKVKNLNNSGADSFRSCVEGTFGSRFVVFETSGTIPLNSDVFITSPFMTIATQTAPSPGVTVRNRSVWIQTHDVVIQHLRWRSGDTAYSGACSEADGIYVQNGAYNIVLDHMSISWATHENIGYHAFSGPEVHDVALLDSIVSESLSKTQCGGGVLKGMGTLFYANTATGVTSNGTIARNIWAHNGHRNPWISAGWQTSIYNNIGYNPYGVATDTDLWGFFQFIGCGYPTSNPFKAVTIGNLFVAGPNTHADVKPVKVCLTSAQVTGSSIYLSDNTGPSMTLGNQWSGVTFCGVGQCGGGNAATEANVKITTLPAWHTAFNFVVLPNASVSASVRASAGARPLDRDAVDIRVVADITQLDGAIITSQTAVGGWPTLAVNSQTYNIPANPNNPGTCGASRTIIECDLETKAQALEP